MRLFAVFLLLGTVACTRDARRVDVDAADGDLSIFVVADADGAVVDTAMAVGPEAAALDFGDGHVLHSFVIGAADLVDADGVEVNPNTLQLESGEGTGSCGRCPAPGIVGPMIVTPGASCPVPAFARAERFVATDDRADLIEDVEDTARIREAVRITAPGDCACDRVRAELSPPAVVCPLEPAAAAIRPDLVRLFDDGRVVGANKGFLIAIADDRSMRSVGFVPATGAVQAIGRLEDGTTLVLSTDRAVITKSLIVATYGPDLQRRELREAPFLEPDQILDIEGGGTFHLIGERFSTLTADPGVSACRVVDDRVVCDDEPVEYRGRCPGAAGEKLIGAFEIATGGHAAFSNRGHVFYRPPNTSRWYCDPDSDRWTVQTTSGTRTVDDLIGFAIDGNVVMACAVTSSPAEGTLRSVMVRLVMPRLDEGVDPGATGLTFEFVTDDLFGGFCRDVVRIAGGFRAFEQSAYGAIDVDVQGVVLARYAGVGGPGSELWPDIPEPIINVQTSSSGYVLATSAAYRLYRRAPNATSFEPVVADVPPNPFPAQALVVNGDDAWAFLGNGRDPLRIRQSGSGCAGLSVEPISFGASIAAPGEQVELALSDRRRPGHVVLLTQALGERARVDVDLVGRTIVRRALGAATAPMRSGAEVVPGTYVLVRDDGGVLLLDDDGLEILDATVDDPTTPGAETPAAPPVGHRPWSAVANAGGVAWVGGFGALGRVTIGPARRSFETFWLDRLFAGSFAEARRERPPNVTALHAYCADDAFLLASERLFLNELTRAKSNVRAWQMGPALDRLDPYDGFVFAASAAPAGAAPPAAVAVNGGETALMFRDGIIFRNGTPRTVAPFEDIRAAVRAPGFVLVGGGAGRVAAVVDAR